MSGRGLDREAAEARVMREALLRAYPSLAEDEAALWDTLDGETRLVEAMAAVLASTLDDEAAIRAMGERIGDLTERKRRFEARAAAKRAALLEALNATGRQTLEVAEATLSVGRPPSKVLITDPAALPDAYVRLERVPNKTDLKAALKAGRAVPGAVLSNGGVTLTIRRK